MGEQGAHGHREGPHGQKEVGRAAPVHEASECTNIKGLVEIIRRWSLLEPEPLLFLHRESWGWVHLFCRILRGGRGCLGRLWLKVVQTLFNGLKLAVHRCDEVWKPERGWGGARVGRGRIGEGRGFGGAGQRGWLFGDRDDRGRRRSELACVAGGGGVKGLERLMRGTEVRASALGQGLFLSDQLDHVFDLLGGRIHRF